MAEGQRVLVQSRGTLASTALASHGASVAVPTRTVDVYTEYANLYPLTVAPVPIRLVGATITERGRTHRQIFLGSQPDGWPEPAVPDLLTRAIRRMLLAAMRAAGLKVSGDGRQVVDVRRDHAPAKASFLSLYQAYTVQVVHVHGNLFLCLDCHVRLKNRYDLARLRRIDGGLQLRQGQRVFFQDEQGQWTEGRFMVEGATGCRVVSGEDAFVILPEQILPELGREEMVALAPRVGVSASDLELRIKSLSLLTVAKAPRIRLQTTSDFASHLAERCFPLVEAGHTVTLDPEPVRVMPPLFTLNTDLIDPQISLDHEDASKRSRDILGGLTRFGSYEKPGVPIHLAILGPAGQMPQMRRLVERLNYGADRYQGAMATFGVTFNVLAEVAAATDASYDEAIRQYVRNPHRQNTDVVLAYLPRGARPYRPDHPYFRVKKQLLREGLPSQMVDDGTLREPRFKDLNLGLNVFAKAGHVPWVLETGLDSADLFLGLSYTSRRVGSRVTRQMAYVNVFDRFGRWRFYQGDTVAFSFEERIEPLSELVANSVAAYRGQATGEELRRIHIHYTKRFSREEREVIAQAVESQVPGAQVAFVSINVYHPLRLFDLRQDGDGTIARANYLSVGPKRLYLTTTGANPFGYHGMGTPVPLELTVWTHPQAYSPSFGEISQEILALTRLNWASTRPFCREPITTKFAGDIAYLMGAFMDDPDFHINALLRDRPWFL